MTDALDTAPPLAAASPAPIEARPPASILECRGWDDYALVDSGGGRRLERLGGRLIDRPEPLAFWTRSLPGREWEKADAVFEDAHGADEDVGKWRLRPGAPEEWRVGVGAATILCRLTGFRHVGVFPEQKPHWDFMTERIAEKTAAGGKFKLLNLFGYTGVASLLAAAAGAEVAHVDASKKTIAWARENQALSGLSDKPIRWLCDDAMKFVAREARRGNRYHGVLLDPPKFGRGPTNERWNLADDIGELMRLAAALLDDEASFLILTAYAVRLSYLSLYELTRDALRARGGSIDAGELVLRDGSGRFAPTSLFVRWDARAP